MGNQLRHSYVDTKFKLVTCKRVMKSVIKIKGEHKFRSNNKWVTQQN